MKKKLNMENTTELTENQLFALEIENELENLFKSSKSTFTIDELENLAPKTYDVLYECCEEEDSENGIETSNFKLIEINEENSQEYTFKILKK